MRPGKWEEARFGLRKSLKTPRCPPDEKDAQPPSNPGAQGCAQPMRHPASQVRPGNASETQGGGTEGSGRVLPDSPCWGWAPLTKRWNSPALLLKAILSGASTQRWGRCRLGLRGPAGALTGVTFGIRNFKTHSILCMLHLENEGCPLPSSLRQSNFARRLQHSQTHLRFSALGFSGANRPLGPDADPSAHQHQVHLHEK